MRRPNIDRVEAAGAEWAVPNDYDLRAFQSVSPWLPLEVGISEPGVIV